MKVTRLLKWSVIPSCAILIVALIFVLTGNGLNLGVDFTGGTLSTVQFANTFDADQVRTIAEDAGAQGVSVSVTGDGGTQNQALIRMKDSGDPDRESAVRAALEEGLKAVDPDAYIVTSERVGAVAGRDLVVNAITAMLIAAALMLVYIWIRFELVSGAMAVIALLHDVLIMASFMVIFNFQINSPFVAAMLTILGYSINNTIIVFDRVRENMRRIGARNAPHVEIADKSVGETLTRSINTSITTLSTILILYIVGVTAIREFAIPIIIGLVAGTYSSIMFAAPGWAVWMDVRAKKAETGKSAKRSVKKVR